MQIQSQLLLAAFGLLLVLLATTALLTLTTVLRLTSPGYRPAWQPCGSC